MLSDLFKNLIEQVAGEVVKGLDEIAKTMDSASKSYASKKKAESVGNAAGNTGSSHNQNINAVRAKRKKNATDEEIRQGLQRFKMDMMRAKPFYGDILMKVPIIEDKSISTACTNGKCIRYNPDFFRTLSEGERNYVFLHEVYHILLLHWKRIGDRDPLIWNVAADWVVNDKLDRLRWNLPKYVKFKRPAEGCFIDELMLVDYTEKLYQTLVSKSKSKSDGTVTINKKNYKMKMKDLEAPDSLNDIEQEVAAREVKKLIGDTIKRRGVGASAFLPREMLELVQTKKLPWNRILYDFLQQRDDDESSYLTPERKYIHMDLIVPGIAKVDDRLGEIWAFVDSSGSIGTDELSQFMTLLYRISKEFDCTFNIAFWDTSVTDVYNNIRSKEQILKCMSKHSGGTDINCVYDYIREKHLHPEVMLILTDGYFGVLKEPAGKLKKKTILVLSEDSAFIEQNNDIGRLAKL
jgi:Uncharacterized protein conserved in bacteria